MADRKTVKRITRSDLLALHAYDSGEECAPYLLERDGAYERLHDAGLIVTDGMTEAGFLALHAFEVALDV